MTDVQKHLLKLLREVDEISNNSEGKIVYFLADYLAWMGFHNKGFAGKVYQAQIMMTKSSFDSFQKDVRRQFGKSRLLEKLDYLHYRYVDNESLLLDTNGNVPWDQHGVAIDIKILWELESGDGFLYKLPNGKNIELPVQLLSGQKRCIFEDVDLPQVEDLHFYLSALCGCNWMTAKWPYAVRTESRKSYYDSQISWRSFIKRTKVMQLVESDYGYEDIGGREYSCRRKEQQSTINKAAQYRRLIDLTGHRFDYWELFYPHKAEILRLAAENDFEALALMLKSYLEQLEKCWRHGETLVFDLDVHEAIKPLLDKRLGEESAKAFSDAIPKEHRQNISDYLVEQGVTHPLLATGLKSPSFDVPDCEITSLVRERNELTISGKLRARQLGDNIELLLENDVCKTSVFQVPLTFECSTEGDKQFVCDVNMKEIVDSREVKELLSAGGVHALRFVLRSKSAGIRLVLGSSEESGIIDNFAAFAYQDEHAVVVPEKTTYGNLIFWLLAPQGTDIHTLNCGHPVLRKHHSLYGNFLLSALADIDFSSAQALIANKDCLKSVAFSYEERAIQALWNCDTSRSIKVSVTHLLYVQVDSFVRKGRHHFLQGKIVIPAHEDVSSKVLLSVLLQPLAPLKRLTKIDVEVIQASMREDGMCVLDWQTSISEPSLLNQLLVKEGKGEKYQLYMQLRIDDFVQALSLRLADSEDELLIRDRISESTLLRRTNRILRRIFSFLGVKK